MFSAHLNRREDVDTALQSLRVALQQDCPDDRIAQRASIVIEELIVNAFLHGSADSTGGVRLEMTFNASNVRGTIRYKGTAFDPGDASNRAEGQGSGRGLHLIQSFTNALEYGHQDGTNHVSFEIGSSKIALW